MEARVTLLNVAAAEAGNMTGFAHVIVEGANRPLAKGWSEEKQGDLLRGHLQAFVAGLEALAMQRPSGGRDSVLLVCSHEYLIKGVEEWMPRWKVNGWRNASKKPVANADLWMRADALLCQLRAANSGDVLVWKGKADHEHQRLATQVAEKAVTIALDVMSIDQIASGGDDLDRAYDGCNNADERAARDAEIAAADDGSLPWAA